MLQSLSLVWEEEDAIAFEAPSYETLKL